nr:MAG TPA: hypothetical protein [Caudoviricetes sp.]
MNHLFLKTYLNLFENKSSALFLLQRCLPHSFEFGLTSTP